LNVLRVSTFKTASGVAQPKPDSTTDFDRTTSGLAYNSTKRTTNGKSSGTEDASGTNRDGRKFTSARTSGDTTVNLVIPKSASSSSPSYPTAGVVTRSMKVVMTVEGAATTTSTRREVVTYDGSATAKITITQDGTPKSCTMALPRGRPVCN